MCVRYRPLTEGGVIFTVEEGPNERELTPQPFHVFAPILEVKGHSVARAVKRDGDSNRYAILRDGMVARGWFPSLPSPPVLDGNTVVCLTEAGPLSFSFN